MATFLGQSLGDATYLFKGLDLGEKQTFTGTGGAKIQPQGGIRAYDITKQNCVVKFLACMFNHTVNVDGKTYLVGDKSCKNFFDRNIGFAGKNEGLQSALNRIQKTHAFSQLSPDVTISKNDLKEVLKNIGVQEKDKVIQEKFHEFKQEDGNYQFNKNQFFEKLASTEIKSENLLGKAVIASRRNKGFKEIEKIFNLALDGPASKSATVTPPSVKEPEPPRKPHTAEGPKPTAMPLKAILEGPTQVQTPKPAEKKEAGGVIVPAGREPAPQPLSKQQPAKSVASRHLAIEGSLQQIPTGAKNPVRLPIGGGASVVHEVPEEISTQKQAPGTNGEAKTKQVSLGFELAVKGWDDVKGRFDKLSILEKAQVILDTGKERGRSGVDNDLQKAIHQLVAHCATAGMLGHQKDDLLNLNRLMEGPLGKIQISYEAGNPTTIAKDFDHRVSQYIEGVDAQRDAPGGVRSPIEDYVATLALNARDFGFLKDVKDKLETLLNQGNSNRSVDELLTEMKKMPEEEIETDEDRAVRVKQKLNTDDHRIYDDVSGWERSHSGKKDIEDNLASFLTLSSIDTNALKRLFKADPELNADLLLEMGVEDADDMAELEIAIGKQENSKALRDALLGGLEKLSKQAATQISKASEETNMDILVNAYADYQEQLSAEKNAALLADRKAHLKQTTGPQPTEEDWAALGDAYDAEAAEMEAKDPPPVSANGLKTPSWHGKDPLGGLDPQSEAAQDKVMYGATLKELVKLRDFSSIGSGDGHSLHAVAYGLNIRYNKKASTEDKTDSKAIWNKLKSLPLFQQYLVYDIVMGGGVDQHTGIKANLKKELIANFKDSPEGECNQLRTYLEDFKKGIPENPLYTDDKERKGATQFLIGMLRELK